jgi:signal transduction histidine kinase
LAGPVTPFSKIPFRARQLRGLRAQLLLWIIIPFALVLIILSVAGIARHRQAMTRLAEDRDRGLTLAEANRLSREVDQRAASLVRAADAPELGSAPAESRRVPAQPQGRRLADVLTRLAANLRGEYAGGLALLDRDGNLLAATDGATDWTGRNEAWIVAARAAVVGRPQFEGFFQADGSYVLLAGAPAAGGRVLVGAIPVETLSLDESSPLLGDELHGAMFVFDATGRQLHRYGDAHLAVDAGALADLPAPPSGLASAVLLPGPGGQSKVPWGSAQLLVTYARVESPGWTLVTAEDMRAMSSMEISVVEVLPLVLLFVALAALLAVSFGVANVIRPLQELDRRATRLAWGDFDAVKQPVGGVQEMDDLRVTLDQMADRLRAYQAGMRDYLSAVTQAQEEERSRLAHELHDDTVQSLIALKQRAQMARRAVGSDPERAAARLDELERLIDGELAALRRLVGDLRPIYLEDLGFVPALEMLARQMEERHNLPVAVDVQGETVRLAPDLELAAFRIVQQALNNVATHAQARNVNVSVTFASDGLTLAVQDDGRGFSPPEQPADLARQGHFGLMGMRERAMLYGGHLNIASVPGQGTAVTAWLPIYSMPVPEAAEQPSTLATSGVS